MAIKTDYRVTDDSGEFADILVFASKTEDDAPAVSISQDGVEICIPQHMLEDVLRALKHLNS